MDGRALRLGLNALGDHDRAGQGGEVDETGHQRLTGDVGIDAADETRIDLDDVGPKVDEVLEVRDPGPGIVDRQADIRSEPAQRRVEWRVVVDHHVLRHLEDDRPSPMGEQLLEGVTLRQQRRRDVEAQPGSRGEPGGRTECRPEGRDLEIGAKTGPFGVAEDPVWRLTRVKSSQRLEANGLSGREVLDRLEDRMERSRSVIVSAICTRAPRR